MLKTPETFAAAHAVVPTGEADGLWFIVSGAKLLVTVGETPALPTGPLPVGLDLTATAFLFGHLAERGCYTMAGQHDLPLPEGWQWRSLRDLFMLVPGEVAGAASRALQIAEWDRTHRFCGACATPTQAVAHERAKRCPACGHVCYPRISPAMMALVTRQTPQGPQVLLGRSPGFPPGRYSALAGFAEPGESIEETVHREVREEVGLEIQNLEYFGSQSWPFPHSLMIAFTAEYAGGEITVDEQELEEARWFSLDELPPMPPSVSISRALIDATVARLRQS